ncbi:SCAN domain-containing protein 3 [Nosema granulosis]|uniref:SCAN domain-containing protein 3 n=1 Tax=Nosema granulosis TaxID=83296 RepID=A0A9P6KYH1_9MICR|nr:SCAN domain-containing protein 3 [Nosema granulosis]
MFKLGPAKHISILPLKNRNLEKTLLTSNIYQIDLQVETSRTTFYNKAYGITRDEISKTILSCIKCQSMRALVTRPIISRNPKERYIADLIDFRYYSEVNDGHKWMLVVVDVVSKYMWTVPLQDKSAVTVVSSIKTIFMVNGLSFILHTDNGKEFCNVDMYEFTISLK